MDRGSRAVRAVCVVGLASLLSVLGAVPARAAFPGRNGLLVVEPASGNGLILVGADGAHPQRICGIATRCDGAQDPVWSPDGSEIAFSSSQSSDGNLGGPQPYVIYPDGSCLACAVPAPSGDFYLDSWDQTFDPGFLPDGRLAVSIDVNYPPTPQVGAMNTDGIGYQPLKVSGDWQQPAWSPSGELAAVRSVKRKPEVFVINPLTGSARQLTGDGASSPTWSPTGRRLAVVHRGWIGLIGSAGGRTRWLTRGHAPAWSPNGRDLAFVGAHDRLFVIAARGGQPRRVGYLRAARVDWQPVTGRSPSPCHAPAGSSVAAASPDATVTIDPAPISRVPGSIEPAFSVLGCLASDGRQRLLQSMPPSNEDNALAVGMVVVAGDYAALVNEWISDHYGGTRYTVAVFDLRTGTAVANRGGESATSGGYCFCSGLNQLVLGPDAATAAHTWVFTGCCTTTEQIVANDSTGTHILDSITTTDPSGTNPTPLVAPSMLSQLTLSGDTLTWIHAGIPESAQVN